MARSRRKPPIFEVPLDDGSIGELIDKGLVSIWQKDEAGHLHHIILSEADLRILLDLVFNGKSEWQPKHPPFARPL